jgi:hypothetical protein
MLGLREVKGDNAPLDLPKQKHASLKDGVLFREAVDGGRLQSSRRHIPDSSGLAGR